MIPHPEQHQAFAAAVERGSVTAAAEALGRSRPTVSRQIQALEARLGLALLHRTTRRVTPTPAGRRLFERVQPLLRDLERAEAALLEERDEVAGLLRVSVPPVLAPELSGALIHLHRRHPRLRVELISDIRRVELRADGVEVALRAGRVGAPELIQRRLGADTISAVASPDYLAQLDPPTGPGDLAGLTLLRGHDAAGQPQRWWPLRGGGRLSVDGAFACNDQRLLLEMAIDGGGIALVSELNAGRALADGRLVRVLPEAVGAELVLHAVFARRTMQPARVRAFVDAMVERFAASGGLRGD